MPSKVKKWATDNQGDVILAASFFLVAITSFGLGRLSVFVENQRKEPLKMENYNNQSISIPGTSAGAGELTSGNDIKINKDAIGALLYVGSKNSNKYHLPNCPGALRIKAENKIWFSSKEEAENLGYNPAVNCDGL